MQLELINVDELSKNLKEIKTDKTFENGRIAKAGLFSQQIFGPTKSYHCACNRSTYRGRAYKDGINGRCPKCHVLITTSDRRRKTFAKVKLPFPILNPIFYYLLCLYKNKLKKDLDNLLAFKNNFKLDEKNNLVQMDLEEELEEDLVFNGIDGVLKYIEFLIDKDMDNKIIQYIIKNKKSMLINNLIVIPPDSRPLSRTSSGAKISDEINLIYSKIINTSNRVKKSPIDIKDSNIYKNCFKLIQEQVIELHNYVLKKLSKKTGLIRQNILGKRVDFSGRAVIAPDPSLNLDQCSLPYLTVLEIFKPQLICYLVNTRHCRLYHEADQYINECIKSKDYSLYELTKKFCKDKVCFLNRQPSLHRLSILGFKIKVNRGTTINIPPMVCSPFNSDFDGDNMSLYIPVTEESKNDVIYKIGIWNNLISPTDLNIVPDPNQDIVLGIYTSTKDDLKEVDYKGSKISNGRYLFNLCLPDTYPLVDEVVNKSKIKSILNNIVLKYPPSEVIDVCDKIKRLGFSLSTTQGYTLSIDDIYSTKLEKIANDLKGDMHEDMPIISDDKKLNKILEGMSFATFINSGARGSWDQAKQLVLCRGYVADSTNKIRNKLIRASLVKGLNQQEFFDSSWGSRKGLLDTAVSTGDSGYITRQLIYSTSFIELDENTKDCKTKEYLEIDLTYSNQAELKKKRDLLKSILWRYYIDENGDAVQISVKDCKNLLGKIVKLRSPIYCKSEKICQCCYGGLNKILHSNQIGMIATQALGERTTQLVLRTFHLSGVAQKSSDDSDSNDDIITGMQFVNKILHGPQKLLDQKLKTALKATNNKKEQTLIKNIFTKHEPLKLVMLLYNLFNQYGSINLIHYEVVVSAMSWTEDEKLWRTSKARSKNKKIWQSILKIPSLTSWLVGAAFSSVKLKLLDGLVRDRKDEKNALSDLFRF